MNGRAFLDTNIFVYSVDTADPGKQKRAREVLATTSDVAVSTQVMNEFYVVTTRKLATPLPVADAAEMVARMSELVCVSVDAELVRSAIWAGQRWQLSHWDALMVVAAQHAGCDRLLTEDLATGASYDGVRIENPFQLSGAGG